MSSRSQIPFYHIVTICTVASLEPYADSFMYICWKARLFPALTHLAFFSALMVLKSNCSILQCFVFIFRLHIWSSTCFSHVPQVHSPPTGAVQNCQMTVKTCSLVLNPSQGGYINPLGHPYQLGMQSGGSADPGGSQADCAAHPRQENPP